MKMNKDFWTRLNNTRLYMMCCKHALIAFMRTGHLQNPFDLYKRTKQLTRLCCPDIAAKL